MSCAKSFLSSSLVRRVSHRLRCLRDARGADRHSFSCFQSTWNPTSKLHGYQVHRLERGFRIHGGLRNVSIMASSDMVSMVKTKNAENPVVVYSKTYCPFCLEVKGLFKQLDVPAKIIELDELEDGSAVQDALLELTGKRTVPQVFVGGALVGGCDDTLDAHNNGSLKELLASAGVQTES